MSGGEWIKIRNWEKWQSYRSDRGQPPWIKVHRRLSDDPNWIELTDAQRGQLVCMWILAADRDGKLPSSRRLIARMCCLESEPDLEVFVRLGFIEPDDNVTSERRQSDDRATAQSALARGRGREEAEAEAHTAREIDDHTLSKIRGLYGWQGSEGTDPVLLKAFDDPDDRDRCLSIAVERMETEDTEYRGNFFRSILTKVVEEQSTNGGRREIPGWERL